MYDIYPKGWNVSSRNADTYAISLDGCFLEKMLAFMPFVGRIFLEKMMAFMP